MAIKWEEKKIYLPGRQRAYGKSYHGFSERHGRVKITKVGRGGLFYLLTDPWIGEGIVLSHHTTLAAAKKAAE